MSDHNPFRAEMAAPHQEGPPESSLRPMMAPYVPGADVLDLPPDVAAAADAYRAAHAAWRGALVELLHAEAAVPAAEQHDVDALAAAVLDGRATPKATAPAARDALARAQVTTRHAREAAAAATAHYTGAVDALGAGIVPVCLDAMGAALDHYAATHALAREMEHAAAERVKLVTAASTLVHGTARAHGVTRPEWSPLNLDRPSYAADPTHGMRHAVDQWRQKFNAAATPKP